MFLTAPPVCAQGIAAANKMREYTQSANGSQAADIHARFYAENALQSSQSRQSSAGAAALMGLTSG